MSRWVVGRVDGRALYGRRRRRYFTTKRLAVLYIGWLASRDVVLASQVDRGQFYLEPTKGE